MFLKRSENIFTDCFLTLAMSHLYCTIYFYIFDSKTLSHDNSALEKNLSMGLSTNNDAIDNFFHWFAVVTSTLGLFSLVVAVIALCINLDNEGKKRDKASLCSDEKEMGYFVGRRKGGCYGIPWWNRWPRSERPEVPTLDGLFMAGDALLYTSACLEHIPPSHNEICWIPFYSAVLDEVVRDTQFPGSLTAIRRDAPKLKNALKKAEEYLKSSTNGNIAESPPFQPNDVDVERDPIFLNDSSPERHTLYKDRILVRCVRKLDMKRREESNPQSDSARGFKHPRKVWVFERQPSVEMDHAELAELSLIFGMKLYVRPSGSASRLCGIGAFGTYLDGHVENGVWRMRIIHGYRDITERSSKGSGYSTLHAKYIACGCLPFGQKAGWIQYVLLSASVYQAIKDGNDICNGAPSAFEDREAFQAHSFLRRMSGIGRWSAYGETKNRERAAPGPHGQFYENVERRPVAVQILAPHANRRLHVGRVNGEVTVVASWSRAVAYVAFGGLVPQSAGILADAIKFTLFGDGPVVRQDILGLAETLEEIANDVHKKTENMYLFGPFVPSRLQNPTEDQRYAPMNAVQWDVRLAVATFSRYMTLIEYFVAKYDITITDIRNVVERDEKRRKLVDPSDRCDIAFEALVKSLEESYGDALEHLVPNLTFRACSNAITKVLESIHDPEFVPSLADVTTLSKCVIAVWAEFVPRIVVKASNDQSHTFHFEDIWNNKTEVGFDLDWTDYKTHSDVQNHRDGEELPNREEQHHDVEKHHDRMKLSHLTRRPEQEVYHAPALEDLPSIAAFG